MKTVMYVNFMKLIFVGERAASDINMMTGLILHSEDHRVARIADKAVYLHGNKIIKK